MLCPECKKSRIHKVMSTNSNPDACTFRPCFCECCGAVFKTFEFALDGEEGRELYEKYVKPAMAKS